MYTAVRRSTRLRALPLSSAARAGPSKPSSSHRYASSSASRAKPMAQLRDEPDLPPPPSYNEAGPSTLLPRSLVQLPTPVPLDSLHEADPLQHAFYPTSRLLESVSMISMCLRRKEHIPRALQIFQTLLKDTDKGTTGIPEAQVFGKVAEGAASLAAEDDSDGTWRDRAEGIVRRWETLHGSPRDTPYLGQEGIKVYGGWLSGLVKSGTPLDVFMPYLTSGELPLEELIRYVPYDMEERVLQTLIAFATTNDLQRTAQDAQKLLDEFQGVPAKPFEPVPRLEPTKQNAFRDEDSERESARFEVVNLRETLDSIDDVRDPVKRQYKLESNSYNAIREDLEKSASSMSLARDLKLKSPKLQAWMYTWFTVVTQELEKEIEEMTGRVQRGEKAPSELGLRDKGQHRRLVSEAELLLYLGLLPVEKLALIAVTEVMRNVGMVNFSTGSKALGIMIGIGKGIEAEYQAEMIKDNFGTNSKTWLQLVDSINSRQRVAVRTTWSGIGHKLREGEADDRWARWRDIWTPAWSVKSHVDVGGYLLRLVVGSAKVMRSGTDPATGEQTEEEQQAFSHNYEYVRGRKLGVIQANPVVMDRLATDSLHALLPPKYLPMLVPPRPWQDHTEGGYLFHNMPVMRHKDSAEQAEYLRAAIRRRDVEPVLQGLDVLSSTPWTVNKKVYDVVFQVWQSGKRVASIPPAEYGEASRRPSPPTSNDPAVKAAYVAAMRHAVLSERNDHAERCRVNYSLEVAHKFQNETFYLPHNVDFRGRAYPIPPHLSPVGDDLNRGLLMFAKKKALGVTGLRWLRIHLANVFGYDKASFNERVKFAQEHEADIFDSAERPLDGNQWWLKAEDPWQCLATCFELHAALHSPDPTAYESSIPVHQDGTCNGMQHYAALGGDVRGAKAVNLENGDRPADIYSRVVEIVNHVIDQDKAAGNKVASYIAEPLSRKIVKQTVMTTVYGVTFVGARDQIAKQLDERTEIEHKKIYDVSGYIARVVLSCIGDLFSGAKDIQDWLTASARLISRSIPPQRINRARERAEKDANKSGKATELRKEMMSSVVWTTPLNLPIVQPYRKPKAKQVMTALQSVYVTDPSQAQEVSSMKQASAFPPNFIHSLDATHMFLTALACDRVGITFASVHDSYWTHAATVEGMSELIRDAFISLHSQDLIGELRNEFMLRYGESYVSYKDAKMCHQGVLKRRVVEDVRRAKVRAAMENLDPSKSSKTMTEEVVSAAQDVMEEGELKAPEVIDEASEDMTEGGRDVKVKQGMSEWEVRIAPHVEFIGQQGYVKFKHLLWGAPSRGLFDVNRIKQSAYFFS